MDPEAGEEGEDAKSKPMLLFKETMRERKRRILKQERRARMPNQNQCILKGKDIKRCSSVGRNGVYQGRMQEEEGGHCRSILCA